VVEVDDDEIVQKKLSKNSKRKRQTIEGLTGMQGIFFIFYMPLSFPRKDGAPPQEPH
jgi:hypothetical protein